MRTKTLLTPDYVNAATPPENGERWISDSQVKGFGLRLWVSGNGGSKAFALRIRDVNGRIVRETFDQNDHSWDAELLGNGGLSKRSLGSSLDAARCWAQDRINVLKGGLSRAQRRKRRYDKVASYIGAMTFGEAEQRTLRRLERLGRKQNYIDQISFLLRKVPVELRSSTLEKLDAKILAIAITQLHPGQSRVLQSFVGQIYKRAARWHRPLNKTHESITQHISRIRQSRK
jgi:hypothetical protein